MLDGILLMLGVPASLRFPPGGMTRGRQVVQTKQTIVVAGTAGKLREIPR